MGSAAIKIVLFEDEPDILEVTSQAFKQDHFKVLATMDIVTLNRHIRAKDFNALLIDVRDQDDINAAINRLKEEKHDHAVVFLVNRIPYSREILKTTTNANFKILTFPLTQAEVLQAVKSKFNLGVVRPGYHSGISPAFTEALNEVLPFYLSNATNIQVPVAKPKIEIQAFVSAVIPFSGPSVLGSLVLNLSKADAMTAAETFLGSSDCLDSDYLDLVGEIANQIAGHAKSAFKALGIKVSMNVPRPYKGLREYIHPANNAVVSQSFGYALQQPRSWNRLLAKPKPASSIEYCIDLF